MPYCRKCGTKLADDAQYCYKCGAQVVPAVQTTPSPPSRSSTFEAQPSRPLRKNPFFIPVMLIIAVTLSALILAAVASAPLNQVNFSQQNEIVKSGQTRLNLNFYADIGDVYVYTNLTGQNMVVMDVSAVGGTSIFGPGNPVTFKVADSTANGTQFVSANVSSSMVFPLAGNLRVVCKIYINPEADLTLNVKSVVGTVQMDAGSQAKISMLKLEAVTGEAKLNLQGAAVEGNLRLKTATGNVWFSINQASINGNCTVDLNAGTGNVNVDVTQTRRFNGDLQVNGRSGTGNIYLDRLLIDGEVAARIQSSTGLGQINVDVKNFNGNQSPLQSDNYPSICNINMDFNTGVGNVNLKAVYQTGILPTVRA